MTDSALTAAQAGLASCQTCGLLSSARPSAQTSYCPRCGTALVFRRSHSIQNTWALIIAATICYVPANILPVLTTNTLTSSEPDTIMDGVALLYRSGSWPLALIVVVASVMIPLGKLIALGYLLSTVQRGSIGGDRERTRLYRMVEFIGRWSMLDVFVDAFVVALVQLGAADVGAAGTRGAILRRGGGADDARGANLRPTVAMGFQPPATVPPWLKTSISTRCHGPHSCPAGARASRRSGSSPSSPRSWASGSRLSAS